MVREDIALIVLFFSALSWIDKRSLYWKLFPVTVAGISLIISFAVIDYFSPVSSYKFINYYSWLGGTTFYGIVASFFLHPLKLLQHILTWKNLEMLLGFTFPFFFLVIRPSKYFLLLIPPLAQILLGANGGGALILNTHYAGLFILPLFIVFINSIEDIRDGQWPSWIPTIFKKASLLYLIVIIATCYGAVTYGAIVPAVRAFNINHQQESKSAAIQLIPKDASVAATYSLLPALSNRESLSNIHYSIIGKGQYALENYSLPQHTEYLLIDWEEIYKGQIHYTDHPTWGRYAADMPLNLSSILSNFDLLSADGSITVWKKSQTKKGRFPMELISITPRGTEQNSSTLQIRDLVADQEYSLLTIDVPNTIDETARHYITITTSQNQYTLPLSYGLLDADTLSTTQSITMKMYETPNDIKDIKLYEWHQGQAKLGSLKNIDVITDAIFVDELIL